VVIQCGDTEVVVGRGLPEPLLSPREQRRRVAVLTQPGATSVALEVAASVRAEGLTAEVIGLPDREEAKTLRVAESVYQAFHDQGLTAHDTVVGVGGGSVTDLAGFVAGTWMRGIEVVHCPTTFLGAVDAAIGGKTGVNIGGKNLVGVFWQPSRVIVDLDVLARLPAGLLREGMAEALKAGLVGDPALAALLSRRGVDAPPEEVVTRAITVKARLVEADPRDTGPRQHLNFGHTIGHAIEYASNRSHGEAVGLGMIAAARISEKKVGFADGERLVAAVESLGLPVRGDGLDRHRILDLVRLDKKRDGEGLRMVLLEAIGRPVVERVDLTDLEVGLDAIGL
jgi:3-dehydroquinate synthase